LQYLELTFCGKQIIANLYANVFRVEHEWTNHSDTENPKEEKLERVFHLMEVCVQNPVSMKIWINSTLDYLK
jgi:hypothetical protein